MKKAKTKTGPSPEARWRSEGHTVARAIQIRVASAATRCCSDICASAAAGGYVSVHGPTTTRIC